MKKILFLNILLFLIFSLNSCFIRKDKEKDLTDYHIVNDFFTIEGYWYDYNVTYISYDSNSIKLKINLTKKKCTNDWLNEDPIYLLTDEFYDGEKNYSKCIFFKDEDYIDNIENNNLVVNSEGATACLFFTRYHYCVELCDDDIYIINFNFEDFKGNIKINIQAETLFWSKRMECLQFEFY